MRVLPTAAADDVIVDDVNNDKEQFALYIRYKVKMYKVSRTRVANLFILLILLEN